MISDSVCFPDIDGNISCKPPSQNKYSLSGDVMPASDDGSSKLEEIAFRANQAFLKAQKAAVQAAKAEQALQKAITSRENRN